MSYDTSKLTNLGQMRQALERMLQEIDSVRSARTIVTVESNSWGDYSSGIHRSQSILETSNYNYYDVHLTADTSTAISTMCANSQIKAKIDNNNIYLFCYGEVPTEDFSLEIITTPIDTNTQGLTYDIGDDYLVYPAITDSISNRVTSLENSSPLMVLFARDVVVDPSRWESSGDTTYPYKSTITMQNITSDYFPVVQFQDTDVSVYEFSNIAVSDEGSITIFCKTSPSTSIVIPSIICYKGTVVSAS